MTAGRRASGLLACALLATAAVAAQGNDPADAGVRAPGEQAVYTPGHVQSIRTEAGTSRTYVSIRLLQLRDHPFATLTYRVADPALTAGLRPGDRVEFVARRVHGENTIVAIRR